MFIYIDGSVQFANVGIFEASSGMNRLTATAFRLYPNPALNELTVTTTDA